MNANYSGLQVFVKELDAFKECFGEPVAAEDLPLPPGPRLSRWGTPSMLSKPALLYRFHQWQANLRPFAMKRMSCRRWSMNTENAIVSRCSGRDELKGNYWKCAGDGVLLGSLQRCLHLFISHKHHLLI